MEKVNGQSCVCKACEKDIKRHILTTGYWPRLRLKTKEKFDSCTVPARKTTSANGVIVHTGLVNTQRVASILGTTLAKTSEGQLIQAHFKQVHRLLHADMYMHTQNALHATLV